MLESHKEVSLIISLIITNNIFFYLHCVREPILNKHRGQLHYIFLKLIRYYSYESLTSSIIIVIQLKMQQNDLLRTVQNFIMYIRQKKKKN